MTTLEDSAIELCEWDAWVHAGRECFVSHQQGLLPEQPLSQELRQALRRWAQQSIEAQPETSVRIWSWLAELDWDRPPVQAPVEALALYWALLSHLRASGASWPQKPVPEALDWEVRLANSWIRLLRADDMLNAEGIGMQAWAVELACETWWHLATMSRQQQQSALSREKEEGVKSADLGHSVPKKGLAADEVLAQAARTFWMWPPGALTHLEQGLQAWVDSGFAQWGDTEQSGSEALQDCARISQWCLETEATALEGSWRQERAHLTMRLLDWGANALACNDVGVHALGAWCNAMDASGWDEHWPRIVARMAKQGDPNTPDAQEQRPLVLLSGLRDSQKTSGLASPWALSQGERLLEWALQMGQALIEAGADPSPRLQRGGRLASAPELHPKWAAFLNAHLERRALRGVLCSRPARPLSRSPSKLHQASHALKAQAFNARASTADALSLADRQCKQPVKDVGPSAETSGDEAHKEDDGDGKRKGADGGGSKGRGKRL